MTTGKRTLTQVSFGTEDETVIIPIPEGGAKGKVAVFGRLTGTGGSASVRVAGAFDASDEAGSGGSSLPTETQTIDFGDIGFETFPDISDLNGASASIAPEFLTQNLSEPDGNADSYAFTTQSTYNQAIQEPLVPTVTGFQDITASSYVFQTLPGIPEQQTGMPPPFDDELFRPTVTLTTFGGIPFPEFTDEGAWTGSFTTRAFRNNFPAATAGYELTNNPNNFTLTYNGHVTTVILYSANMAAAIQAALVALVDFDAGDVIVAKTSVSVYTVTFVPGFDAMDITITNSLNFTPVGVTSATTAGSGGTFGSEDLTDSAALANAISEVVTSNDAIFPYLVLTYNGDADPGLSAEIYVTTF